MSVSIPLRDLEGLDEKRQNEILSPLLAGLNLDSINDAKESLYAQLTMYEAKYGMSSEAMFKTADCERREQDAELDDWATLYRCYLNLAA